MEKFQSVLLKVWREACRHIEIDESTQTIAPMLVPHLPLDQILVRRVDRHRSCVETVAVGLPDSRHSCHEVRAECSEDQLNGLLAWSGRGKVAHRGDRSSWPKVLNVIVPTELNADVLAGPLGDTERAPHGLLVVVARPQRSLTDRHADLVQVLLDPFSVALANDHQVRELAALREAAEAEKRSLLTRLGRKRNEDRIVGAQSGLRAVMERVALVASSDLPVLIFGETGTGKELMARAIHSRSPRAAGPIHRVNCGAIPAELIDSELFGHERGAFTGAVEMRKGWFERADGGTLFLDEIGELSAPAQVRLLRILQDGWLERVGGRHPIHVDVRIVAATHRDLAGMVAQGQFREDLWYRISAFPIVLPPLRERSQDIAELACHFAERAAERFRLSPVMPSSDDIGLMKTYPWPGNVRELASVIDRAAILGNGSQLEISKALGLTTAIPVDLETEPAEERSMSDSVEFAGTSRIVPLDTALRQHIEKALQITRGRIEGPFGAARLLEINPHTLRARMRKLAIDWKRFRPTR